MVGLGIADAQPPRHQEHFIHRRLSLLTTPALADLVAFCAASAEYRESDLHRMAQAVLRERKSACRTGPEAF
jgi:hypothetical protein